MTANKAQRNTQIPIEAIEGPAGIGDNCIILASSTEIYCAKDIEKATTKNTKTVSTNNEKREVIYSTELVQGMSISAKDGGIKETVRKEQEGPQI